MGGIEMREPESEWVRIDHVDDVIFQIRQYAKRLLSATADGLDDCAIDNCREIITKLESSIAKFSPFDSYKVLDQYQQDGRWITVIYGPGFESHIHTADSQSCGPDTVKMLNLAYTWGFNRGKSYKEKS
jgi:hypothetical protein